MKRGKTLPISELVRVVCREEGLETPLNEYRLIQAWGQLLGSSVQSYTKSLFIRNQILYVTLTSSVLRQELMMNRRTLVHKLNEHVKAQVIKNIIFRLNFTFSQKATTVWVWQPKKRQLVTIT